MKAGRSVNHVKPFSALTATKSTVVYAMRKRLMSKEQKFRFISPESKAHCIGFLANLHTDGEFEVIVQEIDETRRAAQNRLAWHWNREIAEQQHISAKLAHGQSKYEVLRPLIMQWGAGTALAKRIAYLNQILDHVPEYEHKCFICFDSVRSSDLSVKEFALYLTEKERFWANRGVVLTTSEDLRFKAMGVAA